MQIKLTRSRLKIEYIVKRECTTESKLESKWIAIELNLKSECETNLKQMSFIPITNTPAEN